MLADVIDLLIDPVDGSELRAGDEQWRTITSATGHSYDVARQGYVTLVGGTGLRYSGDDASMIDARETFLSGGHFAPFVESVTSHVEAVLDNAAPSVDARPSIVEVGAGTLDHGDRVVDGPRCGPVVDPDHSLLPGPVRRAQRRDDRGPCGLFHRGRHCVLQIEEDLVCGQPPRLGQHLRAAGGYGQHRPSDRGVRGWHGTPLSSTGARDHYPYSHGSGEQGVRGQAGRSGGTRPRW